ncbi:hypothetical protein ACJ73_09837 [Blastomyces percursus]|uniref:FeS cluster biogenesis domain-containing protein n=1 Tax=Blastomyces percursus TaxID=1658174 RepID=A0A1J9P392_9EURO|nr:hypothetical protein ACJ73_09837 [Blastomyces percursus]
MLFLTCRPVRSRLNPPALYIRTYRWTGSSTFAQRPGYRPPPLLSHPPSPRRDQAYPSHGTSVRLFLFSTLNTTTRVLHNPKLDDDGNPMLINISPQAAKNRSGRPNIARALFSPLGRESLLQWGPRAARYRARRPNVARCSGQAPSRRVALAAGRESVRPTRTGESRVTSRGAARCREGTKQRRALTRPGGPQRGTEHVQATRRPRLREITDPSSKKPTLPVVPEGVVQDHLRVTVSSGGCHGFQYLMTLDSASNIDPKEDTIFEADPEASGESSPDGKAVGGKAKVVMDSASLELLSGSTVDYTMELIGSQFKITNNPRATSSCGCGTSFDVPA